MTKQVTVKTCYIWMSIWLAFAVPISYWAYVSYNDYVVARDTGCDISRTYGFMVCPSTTDFDPNGVPYIAKQSDGTTVLYPQYTEYSDIVMPNGKRLAVHMDAEPFSALVAALTLLSALAVIAWFGLNSHYKWFHANFKSCEKK